MDTVAWCGFGLKIDTQVTKDHEFVINAKKAFKANESIVNAIIASKYSNILTLDFIYYYCIDHSLVV